jgi:hypothetical protein
MNYNNLQHHQLASMCSSNTPEELEVIKTSIKETGLQVPITLYEGKILSGRARYKACQELGKQLTSNDFEDKSFASEDEAKQYVWDSNNARSHAKIEARLMDFMSNEKFLNKTGKPLKGDFRRKYISALLGHDCSENEVGVADRIYNKGHQDLIELYKSGKYPSTTCDLLAKQTDDYLDDLFKADPQAFKDQIKTLKKEEKEKKHKVKTAKALPAWSSKVSTTWQLPMGQAPISVELTPELVEKTLLLWAKEGVLNGPVESSAKESTTPSDTLDDYFELIEQCQVVDESDSSSDTISALPTTSEPKSEVTVEASQDVAQTTDQAPKAPKTAKTSTAEKVKEPASQSKTTKKPSSNTSRNRVKLTDVETRSPSPVPPTVKKRPKPKLSLAT